MNLSKITDFNDYMHILHDGSKDYLILISLKSTIGKYYNERNDLALQLIGSAGNMVGKRWSNYLFVCDRGIVDEEQLCGDEVITLKKYIGDLAVEVVSNIRQTDGNTSIIIDGIEYAVNNRGFNIVVYDYRKESVTDSVCFDIDIKNQFAYRFNQPLYMRGEVIKLKNEINTLKVEQKKNNVLLNYIADKLFSGEENYRRAMFKTMPKTSGISRKIQLAGLGILKKIDELCRKNNIPYWLHFGTLLGAVRHEGFIPWDDDLDIGMTREGLAQFRSVVTESEDIVLVDWVRTNQWGTDFTHKVYYKEYTQKYFVDIFVYDYSDFINENYSDVLLEQKHLLCEKLLKVINTNAFYQDTCNRIWDQEYQNYRKKFNINDSKSKYLLWALDGLIYGPAYKSSIAYDGIFPLQEIQFEGSVFLAPNSAESYLTQMYGDIYQMPDDMFTHKHHHFSIEDEKILNDILRKYNI